MYVQTIYESKTKLPIKQSDIKMIASRSLQNNINNDLTSYLYYNDWQFLHVLEGRPAQVAHAMQCITNDPIHCKIKIRLMKRSPIRDFSEWPFGIVHADDIELCRVVKNMGYRNLIRANVLDILKVLKRTAGRKYRTMNVLEKQMMKLPNSIDVLQKQIGIGNDIAELTA